MEDTLIITIGSCFILVGAALTVFFGYRILQASRSLRWPYVIGELESSDLKEVVYRGREVGGGADEAAAWVVNFSYRYRVADVDYTGKRVTYSDAVNKTMGALRRLQDRYQGKSQILVYYNPKNPRQSVLVPGPSLFNFTPLITCGLFILAGVFILTHDFT